ncbi:MAG: ParA family protein [Pseudomonadota bacterium]
MIALANQKGGVGKTTTAINLGTALAAYQQSVLIVDLDPQGNASTGLGIELPQRAVGTYQVLFAEASLGEAVQPTSVPGMSILPSSADLSGAEIELVSTAKREFRLKKAIQAHFGLVGSSQGIQRFDYILIDCPPALGLLTLNALAAADAVLVPLQCEFYALEGLSHLMRTIEKVRRAINPKLEIQGVVLTMFDGRNNLSQLVAQDVRGYFGDKVFKTMIPRNVRVSEAPSHGKPALVYDLNCPGSQAYIRMARELLKREDERAA